MAHDHTHATTPRRRLVLVIGIVATVLVVELVGGVLSGSLSLLADAGHMLSDLLGLVIALVAMIVAARPATDRHTWGFQRTEVLAALANGLILCGVAVFVAVEGVSRLVDPAAVEVRSGAMLAVAALGLVANAASLLLLRDGSRGSLNMRGAYLEVLGDLLGSVAVIVAAVLIAVTGLQQFDAIASLLIACGILPRAGVLLRDVWRVLNESAPSDLDVDAIREHLRRADGVADVHDVHVWAITSGERVFSAHITADERVFAESRVGELLDDLTGCLSGHFDVEHSTFQVEPAAHAGHEARRHR